MPVLEKTYLYKIFRNGTYLGLLQNVISPFKYPIDINKAGSQLAIEVQVDIDTAMQAVSPITTESGLPLTTEGGDQLYTEGQPDAVGNGNSNALIRNNNDVVVYEISDDYPNGKLAFSGYISTWDASLGSRDTVVATCLSYGTELDQYVVQAGDAVDVSQLINDTTTAIGNSKFDERDYFTQSFVPSANTLSSITLSLAAYSIVHIGVSVGVEIFGSLPEAQSFTSTPLAQAGRTIENTTLTDTNFRFATPLSVTPGATYYFRISCSWDGWSIPYTFQLSIGCTGSSVYGSVTYYDTIVWGARTGSFYFKTFSFGGSTTAAFLNTDPSDMLRDIIDDYNNQGGTITYDGSSIEDTGLSLDYTFRVNTVLEAIQKILDMSPANWYWYVDPATNILYFKETHTTADHKLSLGKEIEGLNIRATVENLKNVVYFTGGDTGGGENLYLLVTDSDSINANRRGMERITDNRVTSTTTGEAIAQSFLDEHSAEQYETSVTILTTAYDQWLIDPGETHGFDGFNTFVDRLILQGVRLMREEDRLTISLGVLPRRANTQVEQLKRQLAETQTLDNPDTPS